MPLSHQHRLALAGILLIVAAFLALPSLAAAQTGATEATPNGPTNSIAVRALKDLDTYQGECWTWMRKVVEEATGKTVGFDYRAGFFEAGGVEVAEADAREGDIVQLALDADTSPSADYNGLHTAIVLENLGEGLFTVIDSNSNWNGMVRIRFNYSPSERAAANGVQYHFYRIGGTAPARTVAPTSSAANPSIGARAFAFGDRAILRPGADGLNLRSTPSTSRPSIGVLSDGVTVVVTAAPVNAEGRTWIQVNTPLGEGWVAAEWVEKLPLASGSAAGGGATKPVLPFRSFIPSLSTGN